MALPPEEPWQRVFEARGQGPTAEEIDQAKRRRMEEARQQARRKKDSPTTEMDQMFNAMDANHDGVLSREEFEQAVRMKMKQQMALQGEGDTLVRSVMGSTVEVPAEPMTQVGPVPLMQVMHPMPPQMMQHLPVSRAPSGCAPAGPMQPMQRNPSPGRMVQGPPPTGPMMPGPMGFGPCGPPGQPPMVQGPPQSGPMMQGPPMGCVPSPPGTGPLQPMPAQGTPPPSHPVVPGPMGIRPCGAPGPAPVQGPPMPVQGPPPGPMMQGPPMGCPPSPPGTGPLRPAQGTPPPLEPMVQGPPMPVQGTPPTGAPTGPMVQGPPMPVQGGPPPSGPMMQGPPMPVQGGPPPSGPMMQGPPMPVQGGPPPSGPMMQGPPMPVQGGPPPSGPMMQGPPMPVQGGPPPSGPMMQGPPMPVQGSPPPSGAMMPMGLRPCGPPGSAPLGPVGPLQPPLEHRRSFSGGAPGAPGAPPMPMVPMARQNPLDFLFSQSQMQSQRLNYMEHEIVDVKNMIQMMMGKQTKASSDNEKARRRQWAMMAHGGDARKDESSPDSDGSFIANMRSNSAEEARGRRPDLPSPSSEDERRAKLREMDQLFDKLDVNHDGQITREEYERFEQAQKMRSMAMASQRMPNPNQSIEFAFPVDRNDPFMSSNYGDEYSSVDDLQAQTRDPDSMMSVDFHKRPELSHSLRRDTAAVFTPGGGSYDDPALSFGMPGQNPMPESRASMSLIKKDWNMDDKYIPNESYEKDAAHHESISGNPIPSLPTVRQDKRDEACQLM